MLIRQFRCLFMSAICVLMMFWTINAPHWGYAQGIEIAPTPTPTPLPEPTPMPQIVDNTYQSRHGWNMSWNDPWIASIRIDERFEVNFWSDDSLNFVRADFPDLQLDITSAGRSDSACDSLTSDREPALGADGTPLVSEGDPWHSWVVSLSPEGIVRYEECRKLNEGSVVSSLHTYVMITAIAPVETYQAVANDIVGLLANLQPSPEAVVRPTPTPLPPEPTPDPRAGMEDQLSAGNFTEPVHGWSVNWSVEEYVATVQPTEDRWGSDLRLVNETTSISIFYRDAVIQYPSEQGEMVGCSFIGYEQLGGFGFWDANELLDPSQLPDFPGGTDVMLLQQSPGSGEGKIFSMCVDMGNGQGYLRISVSYNGPEPLEMSAFLAVVYLAVDAVMLP